MKHLDFYLPDGLTVRLASDADFAFGPSELLIAQAYVPGLLLRSRSGRQPDIVIAHVESARPVLTRRGNRISIHDRWHGALPLDAWLLLYAEARRRWLKRGLFPVHAACLDMRGGILVVGHSGSGKTSVAMELIRSGGVKLFSGNKTLVAFTHKGGLKAVAGTPTMTVGASGRERHASFAGQNVAYWKRYAFSLKSEYRTDDAVPIRAIAVIRLNDGVHEQTVLSPLSATHSLYPFFLDAVNADVIACTGKLVLVGAPPPGTQETLVRHLARTLDNLPVHAIVGPLEFISKRISAL